MDFSKLLKIESIYQVSDILERAALFGGEIWQTGPLGQRVFQIVQLESSTERNQVVLKMSDFADVERDLPILIRLSYRQLVFKLEPKEFKVIGPHIICEYPKDVFALAMRRGDRYVLPSEQNISLSIKRLERNFRDSAFEIEVRIIDVSETGFGVFISGANSDFLRPYDHFVIGSIDHRPLPFNLDGTVLYVRPRSPIHKRPDVRVGLSLSRSLSYDLLAPLKKRSCLVLSA